MSLQLQPRSNALVQVALSLADAKGDAMAAHATAVKRWGDSALVSRYLKAAVTAGTTVPDSSSWGSELVVAQTASNEFIEIYRPRSVVESIRGTARTVPFGTSIPVETDAATVYWVGQGAPKPLTAGALATVAGLQPLKVTGVTVITNEVARFGKGEALASRILSNACVRLLDSTFLSADAAVEGVSPAGILAGASSVAGSGDPVADFGELFDDFGGDLATAVLVMRAGLAVQLHMRGGAQFSDLGRSGGTIAGIPVYTTKHIAGDSSGSTVALIDAAQVVLALTDLAVDIAKSASVEMSDTPTDPTVAATVFVNFWQRNLVGIRVERFANWQLASDSAVAYISGAAYAAA